MENVRYEVDPHNRLIQTRADKTSTLKSVRTVIDGTFKIDKQNRLTYHVKHPARSENNIPNQLRIKGVWTVTGNNDLALTIDKSQRKTFGDKLVLTTAAMTPKKNKLAATLTTTKVGSSKSITMLELEGCWYVDKKNRIRFNVKRERGGRNSLRFYGIWDIDRHNRIVYKYGKRHLKRKTVKKSEFVLEGKWYISDKRHIRYCLGGDSDDGLLFKSTASFFSGKKVQYEIGIDLARAVKPVKRTISLQGKWYVKKIGGLFFEVKKTGSNYRMAFGAEIKLKKNGLLTVKLRNTGITLELKQEALNGDVNFFVKLLIRREENSVILGAGGRW